MPTLTVLVGLPGSGKSTSIPEDFDGFIYSTDNYIEDVARRMGTSYNEEFAHTIKAATAACNSLLGFAIQKGKDVIIDQTNMSSKKRLGILSKFPKSYRKICICRVPPQTGDEWLELGIRLGARPGKIIPMHIIETMADSYVEPTLGEGFDEVHLYDTYGNKI
jgi:predicted kinase